MNTCRNGICPKWYVGDAVRDVLVNDENIQRVVGNNIFPIIAPEGTDGPFILYQRDKYKREYSKMGVYQEECHLIISVISDDYDTGIVIADMVDTALSGTVRTEEGCQFEMTLYDSTEGFDDNKYYEQLVFSIK